MVELLESTQRGRYICTGAPEIVVAFGNVVTHQMRNWIEMEGASQCRSHSLRTTNNRLVCFIARKNSERKLRCKQARITKRENWICSAFSVKYFNIY